MSGKNYFWGTLYFNTVLHFRFLLVFLHVAVCERLPDSHFVEFFRFILFEICQISDSDFDLHDSFSRKWQECRSRLERGFGLPKLNFYSQNQLHRLSLLNFKVDEKGVKIIFNDRPDFVREELLFAFEFFDHSACNRLSRDTFDPRSFFDLKVHLKCAVHSDIRANFNKTAELTGDEIWERAYYVGNTFKQEIFVSTKNFLDYLISSKAISKYEFKVSGWQVIFDLHFPKNGEIDPVNFNSADTVFKIIVDLTEVNPFLSDSERDNFFLDQLDDLTGIIFRLPVFAPGQSSSVGNGFIIATFETIVNAIDKAIVDARNWVRFNSDLLLFQASRSLVEFYFGGHEGDYSGQSGNSACEFGQNITKLSGDVELPAYVTPCDKKIVEFDGPGINNRFAQATQWLKQLGRDMLKLHALSTYLGYDWDLEQRLDANITVGPSMHRFVSPVRNMDDLNFIAGQFLDLANRTNFISGIRTIYEAFQVFNNSSAAILNAHGVTNDPEIYAPALYPNQIELVKFNWRYFPRNEFEQREALNNFTISGMQHRLSTYLSVLFTGCFLDANMNCVDVSRHRLLLKALIFCETIRGYDKVAISLLFPEYRGREHQLCHELDFPGKLGSRPLTSEERLILAGFRAFHSASKISFDLNPEVFYMSSRSRSGGSTTIIRKIKYTAEAQFPLDLVWFKKRDLGIGCYCDKSRSIGQDGSIHTLRYPHIHDMAECIQEFFIGKQPTGLTYDINMFNLDRIIGNDLGGKKMLRNSRLRGMFVSDSVADRLVPHLSRCALLQTHPIIIDRYTALNNFLNFHLFSLLRNGQLSCSFNSTDPLPFALTGTTHKNFATGFNVTVPEPRFYQNPRYNYTLRSFEDSINTRGRYYHVVRNDARLHAVFRGTRQPNIINMINSRNDHIRYAGWWELGKSNFRVELAPTIQEIDYSPDNRSLVLKTTSPLSFF
ncbi:MAG: hypothetical protein NZT61_03770, partial [Deltaproteobacteria bacterium]|nr:hypothetical protein [Deltaproteobacteria bacterium]